MWKGLRPSCAAGSGLHREVQVSATTNGFRRYLSPHICAALALLVGIAAAMPAAAEESLSILEYDERGRVIGLTRVDPSSPRAQPGPANESSQPSPVVAGNSVLPNDRRFQRIIEDEVLVANTPRGFETDMRLGVPTVSTPER